MCLEAGGACSLSWLMSCWWPCLSRCSRVGIMKWHCCTRDCNVPWLSRCNSASLLSTPGCNTLQFHFSLDFPLRCLSQETHIWIAKVRLSTETFHRTDREPCWEAVDNLNSTMYKNVWFYTMGAGGLGFWLLSGAPPYLLQHSKQALVRKCKHKNPLYLHGFWVQIWKQGSEFSYHVTARFSFGATCFTIAFLSSTTIQHFSYKYKNFSCWFQSLLLAQSNTLFFLQS
jgi:hypothetical protein